MTDPRAVPLLARTLFRQMRAQGYSPEQIISLSTELLQLLSADLRDEAVSAPPERERAVVQPLPVA